MVDVKAVETAKVEKKAETPVVEKATEKAALVKRVASATAEPAKTAAPEVKKGEAAKKAPAKRAPAKKEPVEKEAAMKEEAPVKREVTAKKEAPVKKEAPMRKEAAMKKAVPMKKKTATKKPAAKAAGPETSVTIECRGKSVMAKDILAQVKREFIKVNKGVAIKTIDIYVKPEESVAYYVVDGVSSDDYKIYL